MAGGYQKPSHPAPVSGPGALAKRTDGGAAQPVRDTSGGAYGDRKDFHDMQSSAPMAAAPGPAAYASGGGGQPDPAANVIPFDAPTQYPGRPVTHGSDYGPGADSSVLNLPAPPTPHELASQRLSTMAASPDASPALRWIASRIGGTY